PEDAIRDWQAVLELQAQDKQALDSLSRLFEKSQNAKSLSEVLTRKAQASQDPAERFDLLMKAGEAYETSGNDAAAIDAFKNAVTGIERLMAVDQVRPDAARLLEPCYRRLKDLKKLVEVLEVRVAIADAQAKLPLLTEVAVLRDGLGQKPLAFAARLRAFSEF